MEEEDDIDEEMGLTNSKKKKGCCLSCLAATCGGNAEYSKHHTLLKTPQGMLTFPNQKKRMLSMPFIDVLYCTDAEGHIPVSFLLFYALKRRPSDSTKGFLPSLQSLCRTFRVYLLFYQIPTLARTQQTHSNV